MAGVYGRPLWGDQKTSMASCAWNRNECMYEICKIGMFVIVTPLSVLRRPPNCGPSSEQTNVEEDTIAKVNKAQTRSSTMSKVWFPTTMTTGLLPTIYCYEKNTGVLVSQTVPSISGSYTLINIDENTK